MNLAYNPEFLFKNCHPGENWFNNSPVAKAVEYYLWEFSNLNSPRDLLTRINDSWITYYTRLFQNCDAENILIIGTGFGLLPLFAASGKRTIYACDRYPVLSKLSEDIVRRNTVKHDCSVRYLFKDVKDIRLGEDIHHKCDMLVFDDFDHSLLETGYVPISEHVRNTLLTSDALIYPQKADIYAMCVELSIDDTYFNLSHLSGYQWGMASKPVDLRKTRHKKLSPPIKIACLDFKQGVVPEQKKIEVKITDKGMWNAVVFWDDIFEQPSYCIQYVDPCYVRDASTQVLKVHQLRTKIRFETKSESHASRKGYIQEWHIGMVNDDVRNAKYAQSIRKAVANTDNCKVLDIGAGSGLLSMMAAKANPTAKIYSCEILKTLSNIAHDIIKENGFEKQIDIINCDIRKLQLPEKADVAVHEVLACGLLGEGVLHFLNHAKKHLLKHNARIVPMAAKAKGILVEYRLSDINGINLDLVNQYRWHPDYASADLTRADFKQLSQPFDIFFFDFTNPVLIPESKDVMIPVTESGACNAVAYWFELFLDEETTLSTGPFSKEKTAWNQAIQYIHTLDVTNNDCIPLTLSHDCYKIQFKIRLDQLDSSVNITDIQQFDPKWVEKFFDVEKQYQEMIIQTMSNPEEFKTLVDVAINIASDPGNFNVRSKYASRLAESFFIR